MFDDADLDAAIAGALASKYRNAGQTCVCANRILVQAGIYDAFAEKLTAAVKAFKVGDGMSEGTQIGPLINPPPARWPSWSSRPPPPAPSCCWGEAHPAGPLFYQPTILGKVDKTNPILQEEIFGPVAPLVRFDTEAEAIALANDTPYGLAAYFYGRDIARVWRVAEQLEYGMVGINEGIISTELAPLAASRSRASVVKGQPRGWRSTSRPNTSASAASARQPHLAPAVGLQQGPATRRRSHISSQGRSECSQGASPH